MAFILNCEFNYLESVLYYLVTVATTPLYSTRKAIPRHNDVAKSIYTAYNNILHIIVLNSYT